MGINYSVAVVLAIPLVLQDPAPRSLGKPTGELEETFTFASSIFELPDGRVVVTDPRENRIVIAQFGSNRVQALGRVGGGPGEFETASPIYALGGDSALMADMDARRWLFLVRDRFAGTIPADARGPAAVGNEMVLGTDGRGGVLTRRRPVTPAGSTTTKASDSLWIVRVSIVSGRIDTIARVRAARVTTELTRNEKGEVMSIRQSVPNPYGIEEPVAACADGWLATVRLDPYRVEWRSPSGALVRGAPIASTGVPLTAAEKRGFMARIAKTLGRPARSPDVYPEWPAQMPPVESQSRFTALCSPNGHVLVNRSKTIARPEARYDVVDRRGVRTEQIALSANEHVIGFGKRTLYSVFVDDDGAQHIRRYAWQ